jgi:hypothetical protein
MSCLNPVDVLRVPYSCGVVSVFLVLAGNSFWYVRSPYEFRAYLYAPLMPMLAAYRNLFCFFLDFVVCRFCTSRRCFGYFCLGLAMQVLVEVLVRDSEKNKFWSTSFGMPQECQNKTCFGKSKSIYQNLFFHHVFAMSLGLSI